MLNIDARLWFTLFSSNSNGGGWYAMERTTDFIKVWFWPRGAANLPADVNAGADSVTTDNWVRRLSVNS